MNSTGCDDGPVITPTEATDSLLASRASTKLSSALACRPLSSVGGGDASTLSGAEACGTGDVFWTVGRLELGLFAYSGSTCIDPYCRAAISCGERGRDLRLSFWRRFWNHIYNPRKQPKVSNQKAWLTRVVLRRVWARLYIDALLRQNRTWTSFSFRDTRFTMSRRAALSGLGFAL